MEAGVGRLKLKGETGYRWRMWDEVEREKRWDLRKGVLGWGWGLRTGYGMEDGHVDEILVSVDIGWITAFAEM